MEKWVYEFLRSDSLLFLIYDMIQEFKLTEEEKKKAEEFIKKHLGTCKVYNRAGCPVGPLFSYKFTPTGIGVAVEIECEECHETENITDYDTW